ncbi:MAG: cation-transporting P-type ATPase [Candidatus Saccharimonadales bacterium]
MHAWHSLKLDELMTLLGSSPKGLTSSEAQRRLQSYGYNEIEVKGQPLWRKILDPFRSLFVVILLVAAAISFVSHEPLDGTVITAIIAVNTFIYYSQQHATNRVLKSLKRHNQQYVQVLRDGQAVNLASHILVPGDVILLSEGQRIPADARILHEDNLYIDEAALTGESLPVKKVVSTEAIHRQLYERRNMVFSGTYVTAGSSSALIVATGGHTEFGVIARQAVRVQPKSPMQQKIDFIVGRLIKVLAAVAIVVFVLSLIRDIPTAEALRFVMAMAVAAVPEDLPIALTVVAVLGMRRMAKKNALVRSMSTIEDLGLTTVIAVDKTGTLTKNMLKVVGHWAPDKQADLKVAARRTLGSTENVMEPFDQALQAFSAQIPAGGQLLKTYPFNQALRMSGALWQEEQGKFLYVKGAPEHLLNLCQLPDHLKGQAESQLYSLVSEGFRVIALARASLALEPKDLSKVGAATYEFLGFLAFADELRPESAQAIAAAKNAGISVKMITGDHYETAFHIGKTLGICASRDEVISGRDLPASEEEIVPLLKSKSVFARILPGQKLTILRALKRNEITAMTGDGVNDVPALTGAHVGIAMGSGNDIAKDAGDMVLLDNSFASIVKAISEGRAIYDNIRRILFYLLSTTLGEVITMIGALILGLPLPVTAIMILWINLVTDTALVIPLGLEPPEEDHMRQPPRQPRAPILDKVILTRTVLVGLAMAIPTLLTFGALINTGYSLEYAQTVAFAMLVAGQWMNAFNARSERLSAVVRLKVPNLKLYFGLAIAMTLQAVVLFGPLRQVFGIVDVAASHLFAGMATIAILVLLASELHKLQKQQKAQPTADQSLIPA